MWMIFHAIPQAIAYEASNCLLLNIEQLLKTSEKQIQGRWMLVKKLQRDDWS